VAVAAVGVPLPAANRAVKDRSERFPCENCACGCPDAATCWRECCCHTHAEKLAWAKRNDVTPPALVVAAAAVEAKRGQSHAGCDCGKSSRICCQKSCASCAKPAAEGAGCCGKHSMAAASGGKVVLLISALRCRGLHVGVSALPPSLPPIAATTLYFSHSSPAAPIEAPLLYQPPTLDVATPPPNALA
jgi:hypothetical protein